MPQNHFSLSTLGSAMFFSQKQSFSVGLNHPLKELNWIALCNGLKGKTLKIELSSASHKIQLSLSELTKEHRIEKGQKPGAVWGHSDFQDLRISHGLAYLWILQLQSHEISMQLQITK